MSDTLDYLREALARSLYHSEHRTPPTWEAASTEFQRHYRDIAAAQLASPEVVRALERYAWERSGD